MPKEVKITRLLHIPQRINRVFGFVSFPSVIVSMIIVGHFLSMSEMLLPVNTINKNSLNEIFAEQDDECGLVTNSAYIKWRNYTEQNFHDLASLQFCLKRTKVWSTPPLHVSSKLDCKIDIDLKAFQETLKLYDTIWFIGDSLLEEQFYLTVCMIDPTMGSTTGAPYAITHIEDMDFLPGIGTQLEWKHAHDSTTTTVLKYSRYGLRWGDEKNIYLDAYPTAITTLGENGAIVLDAAYHYDSAHVNEFENVINFIANLSTKTNASVFYMEPSMEEWPTSNGMYVASCLFRCRCEFLDHSRLIGRGNYSDPTENITRDFLRGKQPTPPVSNEILNLLYPNLPWTNNTETCFPDCLPATWRMDMARTILATVENNVSIVPVFWQLHAKGSPSGRIPAGDCTHKSLDAVLLMNEQLARSMRRRKLI
jgi:hypothetical protein